MRIHFEGVLEAPLGTEQSCFGERLPVRGWALCTKPISHIEAWIGNAPRTRLRHDLPRSDVAAAYADFAARLPGFSGDVSLEGLPPGTHLLELAVHAGSVEVHRWRRAVRVADATAVYRQWRIRALGIEGAAPTTKQDASPDPIPFATWIVVTDDRTTSHQLRRTLWSLRRAGSGFAWQICRSGTATPLPATPYVGQLHAGDVLAAGSAELIARALQHAPAVDLLYTDHDHIGPDSRPCDPVFKPAWTGLLASHPEVAGRPWLLRRGCHSCAEWPAGSPLAAHDRATCRVVSHLPLPLVSVAREAWPLQAAAAPHLPEGRISVIVPTCIADAPMLARCLDALRSHTRLADRIELVVVLNNLTGMSMAEARAFLARWSPVLVHDPGPFNWSMLSNHGARAATGAWLLFFNDDMEPVEPGWLEAMLRLAGRQGVGAVGATLRYPDGTLQHAGITVHRRETSLDCRHLFRGCSGKEPRVARWLAHDRVHTAVTGACLLTQKALFESMGCFEEKLPVVFNDVDYCLRLRRAGHVCVVASGAVLTHHEGRSRRGIDETPDRQFFDARWNGCQLAATDPASHPALAHDRDDWLHHSDILSPEPTARISMNEHPSTDLHDTDLHWQQWGEQDPYYAVITQDRFRRERLDAEALRMFFKSGRAHAKHVILICKQHFDPSFVPRRVLDFGCGVGRLLVGFSEWATEVVGIDISDAMLAEARRNCDARGLSNVVLCRSDDALSEVEGQFDLVHSTIVLQHIDPRRGREIFARLVERVRPGGMGSLHLTYAKAYWPDSYGQPAAAPVPIPDHPPPSALPEPEVAAEPLHDAPPQSARRRWKLPFFRNGLADEPTAEAAAHAIVVPSRADVRVKPVAEDGEGSEGPEMQMHVYSLNEVFYLAQSAGIRQMHVEFSDHGGEWGVVLFFRRPTE